MAKEYSIEEHIHRYAVWTAARAVQRGFTTTQNIEAAINKSSLREFSESGKIKSQEDYKIVHTKICNILIDTFKTIKSLKKTPTFGRASKIVSIYLKTAVIIASKGKDKRAKFIYPPIDGILLKNIAENLQNAKKLKNKRWTSFTEKQYFDTLDTIEEATGKLTWILEKYWIPVNE